MIDERFVILGSIIILLGDTSYLVDTIKGKVQPNKVTWLLFALAPFIAFAAEVSQGVGISSLATLSFGCVSLLIFFAAMRSKKAHWKIQPFDIFCGAISVTGLLLWYITSVGNIAILFSILADGFAALPTIVKSISHPQTENYKAFLGSAVGGMITLLTLKTWDFSNVGFPAYIVIVCTLLFVLIKFKLGKFILKESVRT